MRGTSTAETATAAMGTAEAAEGERAEPLRKFLSRKHVEVSAAADGGVLVCSYK